MRNEPHFAYTYEPGEDALRRRKILVPVERPLHLRVNGQSAAVMMCQPGDDLELALGYCLTEGLVAEPRQILSARYCESDGDTIDVLIEGTPPPAPRMVGTACLGDEYSLRELPAPLPSDQHLAVQVTHLVGMVRQLAKHQEQHRLAGGVHAAAFFDRHGQLVVLREDVGRHQAVDKVVGYCMLKELSPAEMTLLVTGRASSSMVIKAVAARIPVLASMSNTTSLGLSLARRLRLTLVTYLRGKHFRICAHPSRLRP